MKTENLEKVAEDSHTQKKVGGGEASRSTEGAGLGFCKGRAFERGL